MKALDLLKKDWKNQEGGLPKMSYNEIYAMIHKKSSSIVKWIFIIGIAEFLFWIGLNLIIPEDYLRVYEEFHLKKTLSIVYGVNYIITLGFLYLFYKNYKGISVIENMNVLMRKILKTRKTVNYYIYYNIIMIALFSITFNIVIFSNPDHLMEFMAQDNPDMNQEHFLTIMLIAQIITIVLVCGLLWLWYRVIYGILLKRLNRNYKELESLKV